MAEQQIITLAYSPCPNDCFIFDALIHHRIDTQGLEFDVQLADVEALNKEAFAGKPMVTKLSFHALGYCADKYVLADAGSALGNHCGPLLISKSPIAEERLLSGDLSVAIPGKYTTANFLLSSAFPRITEKHIMLFSEIEDAVLNDDVDAGLIIHENRFTHERKGLVKIIDLGDWWETTYHAPIPLGGIAIRRDLPVELQLKISRLIRESVEYAFAHPEASMPYVRAHAQEMEEFVMKQHIQLYVNQHSVSLGESGKRAIRILFDTAQQSGVLKPITTSLFLD
jgi:1,4-dihydroxy-6-naphthoate synthase